VIRQLANEVHPDRRDTPAIRELASWGCATTMHIVRLLAPRLDGEDHTKDIDFTAAGVRARWQAGYADALRMIDRAPWEKPTDPMDGVVVHESRATATAPA
jgi:NTE family protein